MGTLRPTIRTALSLEIAGVVLIAVVNEKQKTVKIEQHGERLNGNREAIEAARELLEKRIRRVRPELRVIS